METWYNTKNLHYHNADYAVFKCNGANDIIQVKDCNNMCSSGPDDKSDYCDN